MTEKQEINRLYLLANTISQKLTNEEETSKINITKELNKEIEEMIKRGEIIIININAKMRLGKSTLGLAIGKQIWELLQKYGYRKKTEKFGIKNIASVIILMITSIILTIRGK